MSGIAAVFVFHVFGQSESKILIFGPLSSKWLSVETLNFEKRYGITEFWC